jgi:hypothetical protein
MDIGNLVRRRIVVPKLPSRQPSDNEPASPPSEPIRTAPVAERRKEPA